MTIAVILAAGRSLRMKGIDKTFFKIRGKPLILYTIEIFERHRQIQKIILVGRNKDNLKKLSSLARRYKLKKISGIVEGGKERQDSAFEGLKAAEKSGAGKGDLVLFHNAANPLVLPEEINQVIKAAKECGAALLGQPAKDTLKKTDKNGLILKTIPRHNVYLAQTPQVIEYRLAKKVFEKAVRDRFQGTDDVSLVERTGKPVKMIPCSPKNIKATTRDDLKIIEAFL